MFARRTVFCYPQCLPTEDQQLGGPIIPAALSCVDSLPSRPLAVFAFTTTCRAVSVVFLILVVLKRLCLEQSTVVAVNSARGLSIRLKQPNQCLPSMIGFATME
jgi:hypothetical protein